MFFSSVKAGARPKNERIGSAKGKVLRQGQTPGTRLHSNPPPVTSKLVEGCGKSHRLRCYISGHSKRKVVTLFLFTRVPVSIRD